MAKGFSFEEALTPIEPQGFSFEDALPPPPTLSPEEQMMSSVGEGSGTEFKDIGKLATASAIKSVLGSPEAIQASASGVSRDTLFKPMETVNFLADPRKLTNTLAGAVGMKPIFDESKGPIPEEVIAKQKAAVDEALTKGKIESFRDLTKYGNEVSKMIEDTVSPEMKEALANSEPTGNILQALDTMDFSKVSMGKAPSAQGLFGQAARVFGSAAPGVLTSFITKSATPGAAFGFGQAGGEGIDTAREHISKMSDTELAKKSEYFRNLLLLGYPPKEARSMTEDKAGDTAAYYQGIVGALGGAFTGNLVAGKLDATKLLNAQNVLTRIAKGATVGTTEEGAQELAEGIATDLGIDRTVVREIGVDSFANAVLGAIGGGGPGAVSGAMAKTETNAPAAVPPAGIAPMAGAETGQVPVPPAVTPAAPAPVKMAQIRPEDLEEAEPVKTPATQQAAPVTAVTPPVEVAPQAAPVVAAAAEKPTFDEWRTQQGITFSSKEDYEAALPRLKAEYQAEISGAAPVVADVTPKITKEEKVVEKALQGVRADEVPLHEFNLGILDAMNKTQPNSELVSEDAIKLLIANELVKQNANKKLELLPKGNQMLQALRDVTGFAKPELDADQQKALFARFIPQIATGEVVSKPESVAPQATEVVQEPVQVAPEIPGIKSYTPAKYELPKRSSTEGIPQLGTDAVLDSANQDVIKNVNEILKDYEVESGQSVEGNYLHAVDRDLREKQEQLKAPPITKNSVVPTASIEVAPYNGGFLASSAYAGKGQGYASPISVFGKTYATRQEAIDAEANRIRKYAQEDKNTTALKWLDSVSKPTKEGQVAINKTRQAEKKAKAEKPVEVKAKDPLAGTLENNIVGKQPEAKESIKPIDMGENTEYRVFQTENGWTAALFDKDANQIVSSRTWPFKKFIASLGKQRAIAYADSEAKKAAPYIKQEPAKKEVKTEVKKPSTALTIPKVDESWAEYKKELTTKPSDMPQEVFDQYQSFQKGDFALPKVTFTGANALARSNAANALAKQNYDKAARVFLNNPILAKAPAKNQPKLETRDGMYAVPPPVSKNIKSDIKTLEQQKKALLAIAAPKSDPRASIKGVLVEPDKLVVTDGHRFAMLNTDTGVSERQILDKDGKAIDSSYPRYESIVDKARGAISLGPVNAVALGNYARGTKNAWKYISADKNSPFTIQIGNNRVGFNGRYIEDMANMFRQFGYEGFDASFDDRGGGGGMLVAVSPDGKLTQYVMSMKNDGDFFMPFNIQENAPGYIKIADDIIDVQATEITEEQIMLLTDQTSKLSKTEMATLETHYGMASDSDTFFKLLREDIIKYVNKGADAVDAAIRDIIKKLQGGVLAVAMVFNPAYMSQQSAVVYPTQTVTQEVKAIVPESAKAMSSSGKKAYATLFAALQPELQKNNKYFTVVDKPTSKVFVFKPDGSLMTQSNVVLGKALGDTYVGETEFVQNRITPAGLFKPKAEKGSATYDGKTVYTLGNVKEGWNAVFMHTVYLKESDAEARKKALASGETTRLSHGCINGPSELMEKIDNDSMNESHVFIVPDNQAMTDAYISNNVSNEDLTRETVTPVTVTTKVPAKGAKSTGSIDVLGREEEAIVPRTQADINRERQLAKLAQDKPYYNDFTNDFSKEDFNYYVSKNREENIKEYAKIRAATRREIRKVAKVGSDINVQRNLNELLAVEEALKDTLDATKVPDNRAIVFRNRANDAEADGSLSPEVAAVIEQIYKRFPGILEGLKLSVRENKDPNSRAAGNFNPYIRMVTLWKGSSGVENPSTVRHELVHSLEQMMTPETKKAVVEAWAKSFQAAIKANPDAKSQEFFNKVMDFLENPSRESFDAATKIMPDYDFYQYMNPSEFWAVNAEKMFAAKLGTPWAKFVNAIKKMFEALKSVFGFNNKYALHKAFDNIINGTLERTNKKEMLTDYLFNGKVKLDFLNSIEDIAEENENVPEVPDTDPKTFKEMSIGTYNRVVEFAKDIVKSPKNNSLKALEKTSEGVLYTRIKNVWFAAGLEARDFAKYAGQIRTSEGLAIASLAVKNAIHAGSVATQVLIQGGLEYSKEFMQFVAVKRDHSMKNVAALQYEIRKMLGKKEGDKTINAYLIAKRTRSIYNSYLDAQAKLETAIDDFNKAARSDNEEARTAAYNEMTAADAALEQAIIAYQKIPTFLRQLDEDGESQYETVEDRNGQEYKLPILNDEEIDKFIDREDDIPQLAKILENFTAVNHNMIDMMVEGSRISKERGEKLKAIKDYVPWYRVMDESEELFDDRRIPSMPSNIKEFKKGETKRDIANIIDSMNHNVTMMTRSAIRNYAQVRVAIEYGRRKDNGKLQVYPSEGRFETGVRVPVFIAGRRVITEIPDAMVAEAVLGMISPPYEIPMQKLFSAASQLVRRTVTFSGYFQLKQLFYDAPTAAWVSGVKNPLALWGGCFSGFVRAVNPLSNDPVVDVLRSAGIGGFQSFHRTAKKEQDIELGMIRHSKFAFLLHAIDRIGDASDYSQRISTYNRVLKETGDKALAMMQAADVIDFQKHGNGRLAQALRVSVTFMQAYATQLDVLTQAMVGGNLKGQSRLEAAAKFHATGVAMASLMVLWAMMACGDDDYHELDDDTKARNLYLPYSKKILGYHVLIPLKSSAAMFYKVMPELIYYRISQEGTKNEMDKTRFWNAAGSAAVDMLLGPTPVPSAIKGGVEISLDRNFFTGGKITPNYLKNLEASRQYTASTSELGKLFSAATQIPFTGEKGKENKRVLSPVEADHLMRSLGGSVASTSMYFTNMVFNSDRPATQLKENPLTGGLIGADVPRRNENLYYDLKERADQVYATFQDLIKNDRKKGAEYREANIKMIQAHGYTSGIEQNLNQMNAQIRRLSRSEDLTVDEQAMTPEQKRERINFFNQKKQDILKDVIERRKAAGL